MTEVVLGQIGADPDIVDGDQRQHRIAGGGELTDFGAQVGNQALRRARICVLARSSSAFSSVVGAAQFGVVFVTATFLLTRALHFGRAAATWLTAC